MSATSIPTVANAASGEHVWSEEDYDFVAACWDDIRACLKFDYYFGNKVHRIRQINLGMEILVAATASGSAIAGWTFWTTAFGGNLWAGLSAITAVIALVKPFLNYGAMIENYSKLITDYRGIGASLENVVFNVRQRRFIADEDRKRYNDLRERKQKADTQRPEKLDDKQEKSCETRVLKDRPANTLWAPKVPGKHPSLITADTK